MNTKLKILLRAGVFSLAAVFAFAFTQPQQGVLKAQVAPNQWEEIDETSLYDCSGTSSICTARFDESGNMIEDSDRPGVYTQL
ncbi:DUF6520 family protein [Arthrospiribacter ruber]|jgi:hypothetical protein|uniref:Uncharacterized protein n=1 Tax=Arthrospiribacter ruber TaxID=2487934 RepID=A0A951MCX6_9BACT|nr:DUF6520 family protein [Arthrospiribacter ruber]MBW3469841.1 hypothetical protein [Arthrospiribacter ruber]